MKNVNWQSSLKNLTMEVPYSRTKLRFDSLRIPISLIAKQFYCELQLDHEIKSGKITTIAEKEGTALHEEIFAFEECDLKEIIGSIEKEPYFICSFPVYAQLNGMAIIGEPDAVIFQNSKPVFLIELKTTSHLGSIYKNQKIQSKTYGFALDRMGFIGHRLRNFIGL